MAKEAKKIDTKKMGQNVVHADETGLRVA